MVILSATARTKLLGNGWEAMCKRKQHKDICCVSYHRCHSTISQGTSTYTRGLAVISIFFTLIVSALD